MSAMGIDKGMLKGFLLILGIVSIVGALFLISYIYAIVGGSIAYAATNGTTTTNTAVRAEAFYALNSSNGGESLTHYPIVSGSLSVYNGTGTWGLTNFTIDYAGGGINLTSTDIVNNTLLYANYTYSTTTGGPMSLTSGTSTFLGTAETSFFTNLTTIQTAAGFAAALITVAVILLVFAGFIRPAKQAYGQLRGGNKGSSGSNLGY